MKISRWASIPLTAAALLIVAIQFSAQQLPPAPPVIRINVNLVQVDAVVTDSKGNPVTDLKVEDFELLQDGKPQTISNFEFVDVKAGVARGRGIAAPRGRGLPAPVLPQRGLRPEQIRRTIALVVDDLGLSADGIVQVRGALTRWVENDMQAGDVVAVIRTSAGMGSLQQFTSDKRLLAAAIRLVRFRPGRVGVASFAPLTAAAPAGSIDTTSFDNEVARYYRIGTMGAIQYVLQGLHDVPGRKSLVLFSESMTLGRNQEVEEQMRRLGDAANRSSVVIYAIDPRGVVYTGLTAEDSGNGRSPESLARVASQRTNQLLNSREGMQELTEKTGGLFIHDNNDIPASLRDVVSDGDGYYLLAYSPAPTTFVRGGGREYHRITVRVKRPDLKVRSRSGFFATPDRRTPVPQTKIAQITQALTAPFATAGVRVRLTSLFGYSEKEGAHINSLLYFDANDLRFTQEADGSRTTEVDIAAVTFDEEGRQVEGTNKTWRMRVLPENFDQVLRQGIVYSMNVPIKKPGAYQLRVALRDAGSQRLGSATQFVEVPNIKDKRLALSGLVLAAGGTQGADENIDEGQINAQDLNGTPAVRIFKPASTLVYLYEILNARRDRNKNAQLDVQALLFRDGEQVFAGPAGSVSSASQDAPQRLIGTGQLQLAQIPPGDYVLQVIVIDKLASEKNRIAAQSMDFEVRE